MKKDIRFLLTNMCNYNCYFCHSEGVGVAFRKHELSVDNYVTLFKMYSDTLVEFMILLKNQILYTIFVKQ